MSIKLFLCGDVMTGRGIDQVLPFPGDPRIFESYVRDARGYVQLGRIAHGVIPQPVSFDYIWGDATAELEKQKPDLRIINLETSITISNDYWPSKEVHYRMNVRNIPCLTAAKIDCCTLANNHTLDWGCEGLMETVKTLDIAGIRHAGVGTNSAQARAPAVLNAGDKRVLVFSLGSITSGIPPEWAADRNRPGVNLLPDLTARTADHVLEEISPFRSDSDVVIVSIHWGGNWGYHITAEPIEFAHRLIEGGVNIVHGHSSHHFKAIEIYQGCPILYGCGDLINDYEGIAGHEEYRGDLCLMYFITLDGTPLKCTDMQLVPMQVRNFKLNRVSESDAHWVYRTFRRESPQFGTLAKLKPDHSIVIDCS